MGVFTDTMQNLEKKQRKQFEKIENSIDKKERLKQYEKDKKKEIKDRLKNYFYKYFEEHKTTFLDDEPQKSFLYLQRLKTQVYIINELINPQENDINSKKEYLESIYQRELKKIYNYYETLKNEDFEDLTEEEKEEIKIYNLKKSTIQLQKNLEEFNKDCKTFRVDTTPKKDKTKKGFFEILLNILLK